ncbi:unnamed protein product, partial [Rotaria magnacalcarata]
KIGGHVFALMADEAKDCSGHEQLSIVLRCISHETSKNNDKTDRNSMFNEYLLGLVKLNEFDAERHNISTSLKHWCDTRWDSRWSSIHALIQNYKALIISLEELESEGDERSVDARSLLMALRVPTFIITLFIIHKIFGIIKILSDQLKAKTIDFCHAQFLIKSVIAKIADLRDEHAFSLIYTDVINFCQQHHIDLASAPRQRRIKRYRQDLKMSLLLVLSVNAII